MTSAINSVIKIVAHRTGTFLLDHEIVYQYQSAELFDFTNVYLWLRELLQVLRRQASLENWLTVTQSSKLGFCLANISIFLRNLVSLN